MSPWTDSESSDAGDGPSSRFRLHAPRILLALAAAAFTTAVFPTAPAVDFPVLEVGAVAPDNVIAPIAYAVPKSPADLARERAELARTVDPIFRVVPAALDTARAQATQVTRLIEEAVRTRPAGSAPAAITVRGGVTLSLTPTEAAYVAAPGRADALADALRRAIDRWLAQGVAPAGALDSIYGAVTIVRDSARERAIADSVLSFATYLSRARAVHPDPASSVGDAVYRKLLAATFHPTLVHDSATTARARREMRATVSPWRYQVRAGEKIVGAHEVVGQAEYDKMRALRDLVGRDAAGRRASERVVGSLLINTLLFAAFGLTLLLFRPSLYASTRVVTTMTMIFVIVIGAAAVLARTMDPPRPELIPVAFAAVLMSALFDARIALIGAMVLAVILGTQGEWRGTNALVLALIAGAAAAFTMRAVRRRKDSYVAMLAVAVAYAVASIAIGLTLERTLHEIALGATWGAINAVVSVALAMTLLPPAEELAGVDTYFKLLEWSDLNRPLLQRLSVEAPGTYAHTIAIANLAESASNAIGANGLLARVGAYYHDIGKLKKPQYFVENQARGRNPHDKLKPASSAAIIRDHVRDGMEFAAEYKLPRTVRAFIAEHHGTNPITYFLEKAKERDGAVPPNPVEFSYPGPVPQSAETAIVMLADGVEAAVRVIAEPTPERVREVVDRIVRQRMEQGQLRDAPLTLRQIELVKQQFTRSLSGMHHGRIDYPVASGGVTAAGGGTPAETAVG